ncbi:hypothetical protein LVJ94_35300 [Pendulispora rubella]|uniref:Uncharacterized protein n=1 Tax=Pendulispora rubella TaxID=2741070 RepID=A0ABZ2KVR5_9BACT
MSARDDLFRVLRTATFNVVPETVVEGDGRLSFLGRLQNTAMASWVRAMRVIHTATHGFKVDTSKVYFLAEGQLIFGWRIIIQADDLARAISTLTAALETDTSSADAGQLDEYPLPGASADRNAPIGGRRGAGPIGTVPLGPMALQVKRMGG